MEYIIICSPTDDAKNDVCLVFAQLKRKKKKRSHESERTFKGPYKKKKKATPYERFWYPLVGLWSSNQQRAPVERVIGQPISDC